MNDEAIYGTAPATMGLLKTLCFTFSPLFTVFHRCSPCFPVYNCFPAFFHQFYHFQLFFVSQFSNCFHHFTTVHQFLTVFTALHLCFYPQTTKDSVSPVCKTFLVCYKSCQMLIIPSNVSLIRCPMSLYLCLLSYVSYQLYLVQFVLSHVYVPMCLVPCLFAPYQLLIRWSFWG